MFLTPLDLRADKPGHWVLLRELIWDDGVRIVVPAGFVTDLASIPRAFRWLLQQNGASRKAAVLHDFLYRTHRMTRKDSDAMFKKALAAEGVNPVGGWLYWAGVRVGGRMAF